MGDDPVVRHRVVEQPEHGLAVPGHREDDAKDGETPGEVEGAAHRVDDHAGLGPGDAVEQRGIVRDRLLAHHLAARENRPRACRQRHLGLLVGDGHEVGGLGLGVDLGRVEVAEPWQDDLSPHLAQKRDERLRLCGRHHV